MPAGPWMVSTHQVECVRRWRGAIATHLFPLEIRSDTDQFRARLEWIVLGDISLLVVDTPAHSYERTERLASVSPDPSYCISLQLEGESWISQYGRDSVLRPGDFALFDPAVPYTCSFPQRSRSFVVRFPQQHVDLPASDLAQIAGVRIAGDCDLGAVASRLLTSVAANLRALEGRFGPAAAGTLVEFVTTAIAQEFYVMTPSRSRARSK